MSVVKGITAIYFENYATRLYHAARNLECAAICEYLEMNNIQTTQYIQKHIGHIYDCVEDLISLGNDNYAFLTTAENFRIVNSICSQLKQWEPHATIIWFGEWVAEYCMQLIKETSAVDYIIFAKPEKVLREMMEASQEELINVAGVVSLEKHGASFHAVKANELIQQTADFSERHLKIIRKFAEEFSYITIKIVEKHWLEPNGAVYYTYLSPQQLTEWLVLIKDSGLNQKHFKLEGMDFLEQIDITHYLEKLVEVGVTNQLTIQFNAAQVNKRFISYFDHLNAISLNIKIHSLTDIDQMKANIMNIAHWCNEKSGRQYILIIREDDEQVSRFCDMMISELDDYKMIEQDAIYVEVTPSMLINTTHTAKTSRKHESKVLAEDALINGFIASQTGFYPYDIAGGVKHLYINYELLTKDSIKDIKELTGLNSAIIATNQWNDQELRSSDIYFYDEDHLLKKQNDNFQEILQLSNENDYYLSNLYQLTPSHPEEKYYNIQFNNFNHAPFILEQISFSELSTSLTNETDLRIREIQSKQDLSDFLNDHAIYQESGIFNNHKVLQYYLSDSCRWSGVQSCSVRKLPRLYIDEQKNISSCYQCSTIGVLGDNLDLLKQSVSMISEQEIVKRGCTTCKVASTCSKCTFLPSFMNAEQYCDIRRKESELQQFIHHIEVFRGLYNFSKVLQNVPIEDIRVTLPNCSHILPSNLDKNSEITVQPHIILFWVAQQPIVFNEITRKLMKLSEPLAIVLEAVICQYAFEPVVDLLIEKHIIQAHQGNEMIEYALDSLVKADCIKFSIKVH